MRRPLVLMACGRLGLACCSSLVRGRRHLLVVRLGCRHDPDAGTRRRSFRCSRTGALAPAPSFCLLPPLFILNRRRDDPTATAVLIGQGVFGLAWLFIEGFAIGLTAGLIALVALRSGRCAEGHGLRRAARRHRLPLFLCAGLAGRGAMRGDVFVVFSIAFVVATIALFIFFPSPDAGSGRVRPGRRLLALGLRPQCWRATSGSSPASPAGGAAASSGTALARHRTACARRCSASPSRFLLTAPVSRQATLNALAILPIITPPFVIGLGIILIFGRSGV